MVFTSGVGTSQMAPRTEKVTILDSKMTSQGSQTAPQTIPGDQKVFPKRCFITDFQQFETNIETDNMTLTLRFTLHTFHVRLSNFELRTLHFTLDSLHSTQPGGLREAIK